VLGLLDLVVRFTSTLQRQRIDNPPKRACGRRLGEQPSAMSDPACGLLRCSGFSCAAGSKRFTQNFLVLRFEIRRETQDLKAIAIAHGPEVEFVADLDEARCAPGPVGGSIGTWRPRERPRQEGFAQRRWLPVRDLFRMVKIANVVPSKRRAPQQKPRALRSAPPCEVRPLVFQYHPPG
jgi:hypothetical protein